MFESSRGVPRRSIASKVVGQSAVFFSRLSSDKVLLVEFRAFVDQGDSHKPHRIGTITSKSKLLTSTSKFSYALSVAFYFVIVM